MKKGYEHKEWEKENSLTAPSDRDPARTYKPIQGHRKLTEEEVASAMEELNNTDFVRKVFPRVERRYADPVDPMQRIGLISFVPAKGATPNEKGIYGYSKIRGVYPTDGEASEKAEFLIRNVDSYHQIYHSYVGRPFPLTLSSKYSAETDEIDIRKAITESVSNNIKNKKNEEQKIIKEIEDREKELLSDTTNREEADPFDNYITLKVKKAQITWTYIETEKKLQEMKDIIIKTRQELKDIDKENDDYSEKYFSKYMDARKTSGLSNADNKNNFIKFMVEEVDLGF